MSLVRYLFIHIDCVHDVNSFCHALGLIPSGLRDPWTSFGDRKDDLVYTYSIDMGNFFVCSYHALLSQPRRLSVYTKESDFVAVVQASKLNINLDKMWEDNGPLLVNNTATRYTEGSARICAFIREHHNGYFTNPVPDTESLLSDFIHK